MKSFFPQQAIILAAGLGTRLKPLTHRIPKPALPVGGVPILWFNLLLLRQVGIKRVVINLYHQPKALKAVISPKLTKFLGMEIQFSYEKKILGTAGGIAQALKKLNSQQSAWILNGDVIHDVDLKKMVLQHQRYSALATLTVVPKNYAQVTNHLHYDKQNRLWQIGSRPKIASTRKIAYSGIFSGIHLIQPELFSKYPQGQFGCVMQQIYRPQLEAWQKVGQLTQAPLKVFTHRGAWWDVGKIEKLTEVDRKLWSKKVPKGILSLWEEALEIA